MSTESATLLAEVADRVAKTEVGNVDRPKVKARPHHVVFGEADDGIRRLHKVHREAKGELNTAIENAQRLRMRIDELRTPKGSDIKSLRAAASVTSQPDYMVLLTDGEAAHKDAVRAAALYSLVRGAYLTQVGFQFPTVGMRPFSIDQEWQVFHDPRRLNPATAMIQDLLGSVLGGNVEVLELGDLTGRRGRGH